MRLTSYSMSPRMRSFATCRFWLSSTKTERMIASSDTTMVSSPNGKGSNIGGFQPGSQRVLSRTQAAKKTMCSIRNVMLPEKAAIQSAARSTVVRRSATSSLTLREAVLRSSSTLRRSRLPMAAMMSSPASGWARKRWLRSSRSTASASRSSITRTEAVREPPSRKEISPKTSPGPGVSSTTRSPVASVRKTSTEPSRMTNRVPPGSFIWKTS